MTNDKGSKWSWFGLGACPAILVLLVTLAQTGAPGELAFLLAAAYLIVGSIGALVFSIYETTKKKDPKIAGLIFYGILSGSAASFILSGFLCMV